MELKHEQFATALQQKRSSLAIGLRLAATQIGISAATLSRLENQHLPDVINYAKCCKWLGLPMEYFMREPDKTLQLTLPAGAKDLAVVAFPCDPTDRSLHYSRPMTEKERKTIGATGYIAEAEDLPKGKWRLEGFSNGVATLTGSE